MCDMANMAKSIQSVLDARIERLHQQAAQRVLHYERSFLQTLDWTPAQQAAYDTRVQGIADRLQRVREKHAL